MVKTEDNDKESRKMDLEAKANRLIDLATKHLDNNRFRVSDLRLAFPYAFVIHAKMKGYLAEELYIDVKNNIVYYHDDSFCQDGINLADIYEVKVGEKFSSEKG